MSEPIVKTFEFRVSYDPETNHFSSNCVPPPGAGPEFVWETLKMAVIAMAKSAPFCADPVVREHTETTAKAMRLMILGTDAAIAKARQVQASLMKEQG